MQVMDMEYELRALRAKLLEKSKHSIQLQKEVTYLPLPLIVPLSLSLSNYR